MGALETVKLSTLPPFSISSSPLVSCVKVGSTISLIEGGDGDIIIHHKKEGKKRNGIQTTTFWDDCTDLYHFNSVQHVTFWGMVCCCCCCCLASVIDGRRSVLDESLGGEESGRIYACPITSPVIDRHFLTEREVEGAGKTPFLDPFFSLTLH